MQSYTSTFIYKPSPYLCVLRYCYFELGVYGLIGACGALIVTQSSRFSKSFDRVFALLFSALIILQIVADFVLYFSNYQQHISYASHVFGFYTGKPKQLSDFVFMSNKALNIFFIKGFCLVFTVSVLCFPRNKVNILFTVLGIAGLFLLSIFIVHPYFHEWPPNPYTEKRIHNNDLHSCCQSLYKLYEDYDDVSWDEFRENVSCRSYEVIYSS